MGKVWPTLKKKKKKKPPVRKPRHWTYSTETLTVKLSMGKTAKGKLENST